MRDKQFTAGHIDAVVLNGFRDLESPMKAEEEDDKPYPKAYGAGPHPIFFCLQDRYHFSTLKVCRVERRRTTMPPLPRILQKVKVTAVKAVHHQTVEVGCGRQSRNRVGAYFSNVQWL